jgi:hypothetical protein
MNKAAAAKVGASLMPHSSLDRQTPDECPAFPGDQRRTRGFVYLAAVVDWFMFI